MIIMTQEFDMETETISIISNNNNKLTSTNTTTRMEDEHEEGEILEDGEIADDDNNNGQSSLSNNNNKEGSNNNENNEGNNNTKTFGGGGGTGANNNNNLKNQKFGFDRDDFFTGKMSRRKRGRDRGKKRRFSNSNNNNNNNNANDHQGSSPTKRTKFLSPNNNNNQSNQSNNNQNNNNNETSSTTTSTINNTTTISTGGGGQRELIDITQQMNDSSYDNVELTDADEFKFDLIEFDVFMEILGCKINENEEIVSQNNIPDVDKSKLMCRIVKIMKKLHGNDPDTARRFARLKRRSKEKQNALNEAAGDEKATAAVVASVPKNVYKTPCKFYLDGKCHKGSDCLYSHDIPIPKRKELCKFYLQGFCGKGDDCLFMHNEFPCKFFHTNTKCYSGENCRFSHKPLSDEMREVLRNYLDSGTFPDEVKPYRPINHINDWLKDDDPDSQDFDYEALLNSKTRKVLLGPPTEKMKKSFETWKWQQELKESEKAYVGIKRNLFSIDDGLVLEERPPTPRIEDDEEEIEAFIRNYYNDQLDTDEYEERLQLKEIEELEMRIKAEKEQEKLKESMKLTEPMEQQQVIPQSFPVQQPPPPAAVPEISEEEKRLIEASALDEDLRILPQPFTLPPAFQNAGLTPPQSIVAPVQQLPLSGVQSSQSQVSPFISFPSSNLPDQSLSVESTNLPGFGPISSNTSLAPSMEVSTATNMAQMQQQQQQQQQIIPKPTITRDPRIRDPRLNSANRSNNNNNNSSSTASTSTITSSIAIVKPEFKVIKSNPNLVVKYKLVAINIEPINYTLYHDLFLNDTSLKNDPRLKRFFVNPTNTEKTKTEQQQQQQSTISSETKSETTNQDIIKSTISTISSPPRQSSSSSTTSTTNQTVKQSDFGSINIRDPRMRNRDMDHRSNSIDTKNSDSNTSITSTSSTDQNNKSEWRMDGSPESKTLLNNTNNNNNQDNNNNDNNNQNRNTNNNDNNNNNNNSNNNNNNKTGVDLSSIPSYALSAIAPTQSLFSSVTKNLFVNSSNSSSNSSSVGLNSNNNNDNNNKKEEVEDDDEDEDDEDQLKVDEGPILNSTEEEEEDNTNNDVDDTQKTSSTSSFAWADKIKQQQQQQSMDSDNETDMEIIIQDSINQTTDQNQKNSGINNNQNNESESECENDLIIATSSSETEDNTNSTNSNNSNSNSNDNDNTLTQSMLT